MLKAVVGLTIENESVEIDDKHFIDCTLVNCILEYSGRAVAFERTHMRGCRHVFFGQARRTLHYLQNTGLMPYAPADWGEYSDRVQ